MKNLIINKITAIFLTLIMVFGLIPSVGFAQTNPPSPLNEVKGFNISVFDSHFSRADREITPERWLAEAKTGITQAVYAWELIAFGMYENPLLFEEAKAQLEDWGNKELEERFSQWLLNRFFGEKLGNALSGFSAMIGETQKKYTWHLDDEGNVIFDEKTGDPSVVRPGEEGRDFLQDRMIWRGEAEELVKKNSGSFDAAMISLYPELLSYIPAELRETMSFAITKAGTAASEGIKREFENIAAREQRIFTSRRTRDIWSLRKKSDDEAARIFTEQLISETELACSRGIEELNTKIEQAYAGTGDLSLMGEEWLQLYKEQFDRGLKAWEEAEERFFIRRIEWEQDSINLFSEGEGIWLAAFDKLNEEYQKWELSAKELFNSGEKLFKNISENLEKSIADAKAEFEINKNMRIGTGTEKVKALIDIYITGASAAISAKENVQYWLDYYYNGKNISDPNLSNWFFTEQEVFLKQIKTKYTEELNALSSANAYSQEDFYKEKAKLQNIIVKIDNVISGKMSLAEEQALAEEIKAREINNTPNYINNYFRLMDIKKTYNMYASYMEIALDARNKILSDYAELLGTGALKDILSPDASSEDFYLDEYQLALIKAKTLVLYWERKTSIAQAVISYSEKIDAGRMTEAESIRAWEKAKDAYNQSLTAYESELNKLTEIGADIQNQKIILAELARNMSIEEERLSVLNREYSMLTAASVVSIENVAGIDFNNRYKFLAEEYKYFLKTGKDALYKDILEYGMNWGIAQQKEDAENILSVLINGDNSDTLPFAKLEDNILIKTRLAAIDLFADSISYGTDYKLRPYNSDYSCADWYARAKGIVLSEEEKTALYGNKLEEQLIVDLNKSYMILLDKRLEYELKILKNILEMDSKAKNYEGSLASALSETKINSLEDAAYVYNILLNLKKRLASNKNFLTEDHDENLVIEYFMSMNSFCNNADQNLNEYYNDYSYCSNLLDLYYNYASVSSFWQKEIQQSICNDIKTFLTDYGLDTGEKYLPDAGNIYEAIINKKGNLSENAALFFEGLQKYFSLAPQWLINEFYSWENAVIEYITAYVSTDENKNEKHWRQFLNADYIKKADSVLTGASKWKEGVIEDAQFAAAYYTNRLNDAFDLFSRQDPSVLTQPAGTLFNYYSFLSSDLDNRFYSLNYYYYDISRLGRVLKISELECNDAKTQSTAVFEELKAQEKIFNISRDTYFTEAEIFLNIGGLYDKQYNTVKKAYEDTEDKRFEYEKEDAIRRWASTAYLNIDTVNFADCNNKLEKAQIALNILLEINNDKQKRTYNDPEYNALYLEYEQSFIRKIKALDAFENVASALAQEYNNNENYINAYKHYLLSFGALNSAEMINEWPHKDIITVENGCLAFSRNSSWIISSNSNSDELNIFFNSSEILDGERHETSLFEDALRGLSQRMAVYFNNPNTLWRWSLAREYFLSALINANPGINYLPGYLAGLGQLGSGSSLGNERYQTDFNANSHTLNFYYKNTANENVKQGSYIYWSLSEEEKADLEFYIILSLKGDNDYISGFSKMLNLDLYQKAYNMVEKEYKYARKKASKWYTLWFYDEMKGINRNTLYRISPVLNETSIKVNNFINGVNSDISSIQKYNDLYLTSCNNILILNGEKDTGQSIVWEDINKALEITGKFKSEDTNILKSCWEKMHKTSFVSYQNLNDALSGLLLWTRSEEINAKSELEKTWLAGMQKQQNNENDYLKAVEDFISGAGNTNTLRTATERAYGKNSAVYKNHLENIYTALIKDFSVYLTVENNHYSEFSSLGREIQLLTEKTFEDRYAAELAAREIEWNQMRTDILVKANEWQNSVSLILENGRSEWSAGMQKMNESYMQWCTNFQNETRRVENEWAQAYLAGLEDKEEWLEQAESAFNQASSESFLRLVGTEGERLSRFMDTREPFGIRNTAPEAQTIMAELLQSSGIVNMTNAFSYMNNIAGTAVSSVRKGTGGVSSWDAAIAKTAAKNIAVKTNAELADAESKKIAHSAKTAANEAIKQLYLKVDYSNNNFRASMDNQFIMEGLWRRSGANYEKDIIKGSTLFDPVITKKQVVEGYKNFVIEPVSLKTNLDENYLANLNTIAIRALIENAFEEIKIITKDIFGSSKENQGNCEPSTGRFGAHIGHGPNLKPQKDFGRKRSSLFYNEGKGEAGRLISDFIYWKVTDERGSAEIGLPFWEKRMWNDDNSSFSAPSLSTTVKIAGAIAATVVAVVLTPFSGGASLGLLAGVAALTAGINSTSDLIFSSLSYAYGYKTLDEACFDVGKASLINSTSSAISGVFGSFGNLTSTAVNAATAASSTAGTIITHTAMAGLQSATSTIATSQLNAITYNSKDGFGWSNEIFASSMKSGFTDALISMTSTATTQSLTAVNSGFDLGKLIGFNDENKMDLGKFNDLAGSLAGQGLNYAMGNDFTLNLLDIGLFINKPDNEKQYHSGLLELHLGHNDTTMSLGTGGANFSLDNLASAVKGLEVWDVNSRINRYIKKEDDFNSAIALRVQYGFGDKTQKDQLWDILKGRAIINTSAENDGITKAKTVIDSNGKKEITLFGYKSGMSVEDQLVLGVTLGHEAYRDGIVKDDNYLETRTATFAHTEMAIRMIQGGYLSLFNNDDLRKDIVAYQAGGDFFNNYVDNNYDSSGDFWKLTINQDGTVGFLWDNKYTFDLTAMKGYEGKDKVDKLDEKALLDMWNLGGNKSFETFDEFKKGVGTYDSFNKSALALEKSLVVGNKQNVKTDEVNKQISDFYKALDAVGSSGLFMKTDAKYANLGEGPHVFANGKGTLTSDFGIRVIDWGTKFGSLQWHGAWDIVSDGNSKLVAPMDGVLSLDFTKGGGLKIITYGEDNQKITYAHTDSSSLLNYIELFSYNGVTLKDGKLNGIAQNMIIGVMGNTGTETTGAHVHLTYTVNGKEQDPSLFFDKTKYNSDFYFGLMSGLSNDPDVNNFKYTPSQIFCLSNYLYSTYKTDLSNKFFSFSKQTDQGYDFIMHAQNNKYWGFLP